MVLISVLMMRTVLFRVTSNEDGTIFLYFFVLDNLDNKHLWRCSSDQTQSSFSGLQLLPVKRW